MALSFYELHRQQRRLLLSGDREAQARVLAAWAEVFISLRGSLEEVLAMIAEQRRRGLPVTESWLRRQSRYERLLQQVAFEATRFGVEIDSLTTTGQRSAIALAREHSASLLALGLLEDSALSATFDRVNVSALEALVGSLTDGSPLRDVTFAGLPATAVASVESALLEGIATGRSQAATTRVVRDAMEVTRAQASRIVRTETNRAYRVASLEQYRANEEFVTGWIWVASLSERTCAMCWAMHGSFHRLGEEFASHVNCRCTVVPAIKGIPSKVESGVAAFGRLSEDSQKEILGPAKFAAFKSGEIGLKDTIQRTKDERWGPGRQERSLKRIREAKGTRRSA